MRPIKVLSLFDGISCGMVALERAGIPVERYVAYEIDKYAIKVSEKNYPQIEHCGDVFDGDFTQYRGFDLLIGGSPCQHWSIAKKGRETTPDGIGGRLFMQYVRALKESGCKYFLYENVQSMPKNIMAFISDNLGVEPIMINSALVSAQRRKRFYWTNIEGVKQPEDKGILLKDIIESGMSYTEKSYCYTANSHKQAFPFCLRARMATHIAEPILIARLGKYQQDRVFSVEGKSITLCANGGGKGAKTGLYHIDLPDGDYNIRKLTPLECERLQTLPDDYTAGISNTQRYKCIGNGWTVDVIAHILRGLKEG